MSAPRPNMPLPKPRRRNKEPPKPSQAGSLILTLNLPVFVPLLKLLPEIRNCIWQYSLRFDDGTITVNEKEDFPEPALLRSCKAIRNEAIGIYYLENYFFGTVTSYSPSLPKFIGEKMISLKLAHDCRIPRFDLILQGPHRWNNLVSWLKLIHQTDIFALTHRTQPEHMFPGVQGLDKLEEHVFLVGIFTMVIGMECKSWDYVETILDMFRIPLRTFDAQWTVEG